MKLFPQIPLSKERGKKADIDKLANKVELTLDLNGHLICVDTAAELLVDSIDFAPKKTIPASRLKLASFLFFST